MDLCDAHDTPSHTVHSPRNAAVFQARYRRPHPIFALQPKLDNFADAKQQHRWRTGNQLVSTERRDLHIAARMG